MSKMSSMVKGQHGSSNKDSSGGKMYLVKKIVAAVSKTGLSSNQVASITSAKNPIAKDNEEIGRTIFLKFIQKLHIPLFFFNTIRYLMNQ